ncbi:SDR family NAD(P)-dependent oxidoreductase [Deinococcus sp. NW-56]|uniref:SDR family NAD(P)-dependent oxidoreductase n=1 Tax=Deinococcus sp. NW-56 TaxID=2080419 RepID=UPI000CF4B4B7|nr:SDR family NAD(P)-dependent oxidoreductase [Deinococcus sp. NW-56]
MLLDLSGQVALVTGSTRGIGWATAQLLAEQGATVVLNGAKDQAGLDRRVEELAAQYGVQGSGILCDARDPDQIRQVYQQIFKTYRRLDILVNNAGILDDALIGMVSDELVTRTYEVNTFGAIHHLQGAARLMQRGGRGSIVNLTSIVGVNGNEGQIVYSSSKAALVGLTRSAAKELAPKGIRVNAIAPGFIDTDMTRSLPTDKFEERMASIKMSRIGTPEDIAKGVLFFVSDLSTYVTGQVLGVDGGMLI